MDAALTDLTDDQLAEEITTWAGRVAAGEARLIRLIGEFEAVTRGAGRGLLSCAHWLSWRLGLGLGAAREKVRVAKRLRELPQLAEAFVAGRLSWSQVRAITRVGQVLDEEAWLVYARSCTGEPLERLVRAVNRATRPEREAADPELAAWRTRPRVRRTDDGMVHLTFVVPGEVSEVVLAGMERVAQQIRDEPVDVPPGTPEPPLKELIPEEPVVQDWNAVTEQERAALERWRRDCQEVDRRNTERARHVAGQHPRHVTVTDALVRLAVAALDAPGPEPPAVKERLRIQIDPISGWARTRAGELLPPGTVSQPEGTFVPLDRTVFDAGRTRRDVPLPLRRLLGDLDGERCRFPGCSRITQLHAHHVRCWSHGGRTDLDNLVNR